MLWGKKDKALDLPDLPPVKTLQKLNHDMNEEEQDMEDMRDSEDNSIEKHGLPSFPDSPHQKGFSQAAIKDAIATNDAEDKMQRILPLNPIHPRTFKTIEMESPWQTPQPFLSPPPENSFRFAKDSEQKNRDVFVKIDKFYSARRALETTKEKLNSIDELLRKIRETKMREEQELSAWEKEMSEVRAHIQEVTAHIFEKIE